MPSIAPSTFTRFTLSQQEEQVGGTLNYLQKCSIHNLLASAAEEKLSLELDPQNPQRYIQQEASLAGQIKILQFLLATSESYEQLAQPSQEN